jgi:DNA-binding MarR family transcriptional regulator
MVNVDTIVRKSMIVQMTRSTLPSDAGAPIRPTVAKAAIVADFRASMAELKCIGSERLVRQGISMTQLHVMHLLDHHGEMPMSRLAEMLDVSLSNGTGLIDRVEERGFVERTRIPTDRRMVMVRLTPAGRQMLDEIETVREQVLRRVLDQLDATQLTGVAKAMADLRDAVAATATGADAHHHAHETPGRH